MMKCAYFLTDDHTENVNENYDDDDDDGDDDDDDDGEYLQERLT